LPLREAKNWYGENMRDRHDPGSLDAAVTSYLTSKYFTELAPGTQRMRRNLLKNICAEVQRLSAAEISEARNEIPSETPARSVPWRPVHQRRNWRTA
jgi:hypothetical protein